jgi:recombination protein RecR
VAYPEPLEALVQAFERFPGIGRRSAERLAFHVLRDPAARDLARAIDRAVEKTRRCTSCSNVSESDPCAICADARRDAGQVCVVEEPRHVEAVERSGAYRGRYHVLMGSFNPADGTEERHLTLARLVRRVEQGGVREVILGTDPDAEGEATAMLVLEALESLGRPDLVVTRLARGLPAGSAIEYLHRGVLEDALADRRPVRARPRGQDVTTAREAERHSTDASRPAATAAPTSRRPGEQRRTRGLPTARTPDAPAIARDGEGPPSTSGARAPSDGGEPSPERPA